MGTIRFVTERAARGSIRDQSTGEIVGSVTLSMDHSGYRYWEAQAKDGPCKRFYLVDHGEALGSNWGTAEHRAVAWIMDTLEGQE